MRRALTVAVFLVSAADATTQEFVAVRAQLDQIRSGPGTGTAIDDSIRRPDPFPLIGLSNAAIVAILGQPDFCQLRRPGGSGSPCDTAGHWAYFFYKFPAPNKADETAFEKRTGLVRITVRAGGGWALEMRFTDNHEVSEAYWRKQT